VGLLRRGAIEEPLHVLDGCRIRWGRVETVDGDRVQVLSRPLVWSRAELTLGALRLEEVTWQRDGQGFVAAPRPGARVAMHWGWLCDVLTPRRLCALREQTARQLDLVARRVAHPGPAALCA
jgi:hypothetical protein